MKPDFWKYIKKDVSLKPYSNWKIGGYADFFAEPQNLEQLRTIIKGAQKENIPFQVIGDGTNILFDDKGYRGLIIKIGREFSNYTICDNLLTAEAGVWMPCLARITANNGLTGLEHTIGIPGTLGGLVIMNGGSLRKSISENISKVYSLDYDGNEFIFDNKQCEFAYRQSIFQSSPLIVYKAELTLKKGKINIIRSEMLKILEIRRKKFPLKLPNCGSVFVSHPLLYERYGPPGKIIEDLGLKGYAIGAAMISDAHANFIVNTNNATSKEILMLVKHVQHEIYKKTNTWVESEIRYLTEYSELKFLHKA